ncbi:MAG: hypothetical protein N4A45_10420 [Flavobacteriales bacterium]|jgi:hypothetical protein|nr:hypothetical protein [Flavobacteriales bacterium]
MGYRNYIASIPRKEYDKIKNFTREELYKYKNEPMNGHVGVHDVAQTTLYELGKYVDSFPKQLFKPVFLNKELQRSFTEEHDFYLVGRKFLESVMDLYANKVKDYYKKLLEPIISNDKFPRLKDPKEYDSKDVFKLAEHIKSMAFEWNHPMYQNHLPYNLNNGDAVTTSHKYEYAQFELVRIYKTFDWKNNVLIYYGH